MTTEEMKILLDEVSATDATLARLFEVLALKGMLTPEEATYVAGITEPEPPKLTVVK